jgi:fructosamine-3-kinase
VNSLPASLRESIESAAAQLRIGSGIASLTPVGGGCIHHGVRLSFDSGVTAFAKWNRSVPRGMFEAEAAGLEALREATAVAGAQIRVPDVIAHGRTADGGWLLLEWVPAAGPTAASSESLGRGLALLHELQGRTDEPDARGYGWQHDNWIGSLPQSNRRHHSWADFWSAERIRPQLERARLEGLCRATDFDRLVDVIPTALGDDSPRPSLLHGDLWSGNVYATEGGRPVMIDPAAYRGDGEVDLAMTELFGGFDERFYRAYREVRPASHGYSAWRRDLYQLYYLLVHVNLFGRSYEAGACSAARRVVAELG